MKQYNNEKYIVSFTSFGERIKYCEKMLKQFENQTYKDFHLVLTLWKDDLQYITDDLKKRLDNNELELIVTNEDLKSHKKYFYVMQKYFDKPIITIDDDRLYEKDTIEKLVKFHEKYPSCVICNCAIKMRMSNNRLLPYSYWNERLQKDQLSYIAMPDGFGGILYPENCFNNLNEEIENIHKCIYDDDLFLKVLEIKHNIPVVATGDPGSHSEDNNIQEMIPYNLHQNQNKGNINRNNMCMLFENELIKGFNINKKVILSMTTIPSRQKRLEENIESLLKQTYKFDELVINIDDNLSKEDLKWYEKFSKKDSRIEIGFGEAKWRSCNKLLPTLKKYPDDIIVTVDDDIYYPKECLQKLMDKWNDNQDCIIAHETNPLQLDEKNKKVIFLNELDVMFEQKGYGKYLSNFCLFPPHCFDGTDLFDYDKMMSCTFGTHDELWFWIQSTLNHVKVIGLSYVYSFETDVKSNWENREYRLTSINCNPKKTQEYVDAIYKEYGTRLYDIISTEVPEFYVNPNNVLLYIYGNHHLKMWYNYGFKFKISKDLTSYYIKMIKDTYYFKNS